VDARALRLLAETLLAETPIEGADPKAAAPADRLSVSVDALTTAPLQQLLQTIEQHLFPAQTAAGSPQVQLNAAAYSHPAQAKEAALQSLDKAAQAIETGGIHGARIPENLDPQTVLALATRMIATEQYPNYLRAAELGNVIASWYDGPLTVGSSFRTLAVESATETQRRARRESSVRRQWTDVTARLWKRAPLLVLLAGWLLAGITGALLLRVADIPTDASPLFTIWALGFPALIVLQFALTIRGAWRNNRRW
jgi:hypothetical protein